MSDLRILYIVHNHPALHPGGTEIFAHDLFGEVKSRAGVEALFVACTDKLHRERKPGTVFQGIGDTADELLLWTGHFDRFFLSQRDLYAIVPALSELLAAFRPNVIHFHHALMIGVEAIALVRRLAPEAKIVFTMHEYMSMCANEGQMVTPQGRLCHRAGADACHACFPKVGLDQFVLRERFIKSMYGQADAFIAPSRFLRTRAIEWGLPAEKVRVVANGVHADGHAPKKPSQVVRPHDRFGFFGHINPFKGAMVALEAARRLADADEFPFTLSLHGGADYQTDAFKAAFQAELDKTPAASWRGPYAREGLPALMADVDWVIVPSVWWENAPLIIQEAFASRRPVICSNIGGMAEMVRDGVDGLHFQAGDAADLARTLKRAATTPQLWQRLSAGIMPPRTIAAAADEHLGFYRELLSGVPMTATPAVVAAPPSARRWINPIRPESHP